MKIMNEKVRIENVFIIIGLQILALVLFLSAHFLISIYYYSGIAVIVYVIDYNPLRFLSDLTFIPAIILQIFNILLQVKKYGIEIKRKSRFYE